MPIGETMKRPVSFSSRILCLTLPDEWTLCSGRLNSSERLSLRYNKENVLFPEFARISGDVRAIPIQNLRTTAANGL
jgi:hypothetical protein